MSKQSLINEFVRRRLRRFRKARRLTMHQVAQVAQLPTSSYACLETGVYEFRLENLYKILAALDLDISDVWPPESYLAAHPEVKKTGLSYDQLYLRRLQDFRMNEIVMLTEAQGAALFKVTPRGCELLMHAYLREGLLDRLLIYLEARQEITDGLIFAKPAGEGVLILYLKSKSVPRHVGELIEKYLRIWSEVY